MESLRIFKLLLYKNYLVYKRQWLLGLIGEILIPIGIIACIWAVRNANADPPRYIENEKYYAMQSKEQLIEQFEEDPRALEVFFAPTTDFTVKLMEGVRKCFNNRLTIVPFETEEEIIHHESVESALVLIFNAEHENIETKSLQYKFRGVYLTEENLYNTISQTDFTFYYTWYNVFIQTQICLDETFIRMKMPDGSEYPNVFVQQMPYPPYTKQSVTDTILRHMFSVISTVIFIIPLFIETSRASNEKFLGVNVLMSMNGVSNSLNLLSWLFTGLTFLSIFCVLPIVVMMLFSTGHAIPYVNYSNPLIILTVYFLFIAHLLAFGIHVSAYFSRSLLVMFALLILNVASMVLQLYAFDENTYWIAPYLGILFPNILLYRAIEELNNYENIAEGIQWNNLLLVGNSDYKLAGSVAMIVVLSIVGIILHFLLAIYIYAINPGKYGVKKHPLFFLMRQNKKHGSYDISFIVNDENHKSLFESIPDGACATGIQIRDLTKEFNCSLFNKSKVHALRGVSMDLHKSQITSLLGHNGAGKTTMMSILTGMISPSNGSVFINSKDIKYHANEIMNDMGLCTQENMVFPSLSVGEQLQFFAMLKGKGQTMTRMEKNVENLLEKLKLKDKKNSLPKDLSGGQKRRLCLGMALIGDSSILILDEPTSGLDPESRRVIWDVLLKIRAEKTILISTHDMEEADVLGDRIAVLHEGKLKSYGTGMFLKKLLGKNSVQVNLSVEPWCDHKKICHELKVDSNTIIQDGSKMVVTIPDTPDMPDLLDNIEEKKKDLGISGFSASLMSLEQVFLKLTRENSKSYDNHQPFGKTKNNLQEKCLFTQTIQALLRKKLTYTLKNVSTIIIMLFLVTVGLLCISMVLKEVNRVTGVEKKIIPIRLDMYNEPEVYYKSEDEQYGKEYEKLVNDYRGSALEIENSSLVGGLMSASKKSLAYYNNHIIAGAEFNVTTKGIIANAFYSGNATFAFPIAINLLSNTIADILLGHEYSINVSSQGIPSAHELRSNPLMPVVHYFTTAVIFVFFFCPAIALFVLHPLRETTNSVKQLQIMTGISSVTYWATMFTFDMIVYLFLIGVVIFDFIIIDYFFELDLYANNEILVLLLTLIMFAINSLPLVYIFSFMKATTSYVVRLLTYIPVAFVILEIIMYTVRDELGYYTFIRIIRDIQKRLFLFVPYVSFFHSQIAFHRTTQINARCKILPNTFYERVCRPQYPFADLCCMLDCHDGECKVYKKFFTNFNEEITLEESLLFLAITPIIYFGILIMLEQQSIQKLRAKINNQKVSDNSPTDSRVIEEKTYICRKIDKIINKDQESYSNDQEFLVYQLRKQYGELVAVKDVSFKVGKSKCFGLLGINGAGKSTTFRMMTGGEIADSGTMYIGDQNIEKNRKSFLSQMGYCPQDDAIVRSLNAYDHLRLFARLRGISEDQVNDEVETWIQRLNLNACASQASGSYSGGNKRRLNIAIALIGNPNLVLMDEPTTGVDPGARRSLWNVIKSCQMTGQAVVLTSHSMEECEALCDRLAIMVDGRLLCIGPSEELKERFGAGYDIQMKLNPEKAIDQVTAIKADIVQKLNSRIVDENFGHLMYHVAPDNTNWRKMYNIMNEMRRKYDCIDDFSIQSSTLEQLFLLFARTAEKDCKRRTD